MMSFTTISTTNSVHSDSFFSKNTVTSATRITPPTKRCIETNASNFCKKRRKQSKPFRLLTTGSVAVAKGKSCSTDQGFYLQSYTCHISLNNADAFQEHADLETIDESDIKPLLSESPLNVSTSLHNLTWFEDLQNKDWMDTNVLPELSFPSAASFCVTLPLPAQTNNVSVKQPIRIFNPDAYCGLCKKEFCNKYFLKTHKANKHGIYSAPVSISDSYSSVVMQSFTSNLKACKDENSENNFNESELETLQTQQFNSLEVAPLSKSFQPFSLNKAFPNIHTRSTHISFDFLNDQSEETESMIDETCGPTTNHNNTGIFKQDAINDEPSNTPLSEISPTQLWGTDFDHNRQKKLGVINPKAFCEICCKEFCNKYFLRTHKMKRHGVAVLDDIKDQRSIKYFSNFNENVQNTQTSPLNLIMSEQNNSNCSEIKLASPADGDCDTCGIQLQNCSFSQLQKVNTNSPISQLAQDLPSFDVDDITKGNLDFQISSEKLLNRTDSISEDLQKLQTMILQLNNLEVDKTPTMCYKKYESRLLIHAHVMRENGMAQEDIADTAKNGDLSNDSNQNLTCDICTSDIPNSDDLKKHFADIPPARISLNEIKDENGHSGEKGSIRTSTSPSQCLDVQHSIKLTPSSSYCEICNKELCNKYFMKTHMQRMHGIEIENGAQIGGVICNICNKELCSKYFLRVHKHNTHGIAECGSALLPSRKEEPETTTTSAEVHCALKSIDLAALSHRYFTHFTEVCAICSRRFRSTKWLKSHLLRDHGQIGAAKCAELEFQMHQLGNQSLKLTEITNSLQTESVTPTLKQDVITHLTAKNMLSTILGTDETFPKLYYCPLCSFSTHVLPYLFIHERSHIENGESFLTCSLCNQKFFHIKQLQHHLLTHHPLACTTFSLNTNTGLKFSSIPFSRNNSVMDNMNTKVVEEQCAITPQTNQERNFEPAFSETLQVTQSLKDVSRNLELPVTYALPQERERAANNSYEMQAFLIDEPVIHRTFVPSVIFLPVLQRLSTPITATFTLTPT